MGLADLQETASPLTLQAVVIFLTVCDLIAVSLRLYTRHVLGQSFKIDDWFALVAFFFVLALAVYFITGVSQHYLGYPVPEDFTGEVYDPLISGSLQQYWIWSLLLFPTFWLIKCSFIFFYRRVLVASKNNYRDFANVLVISALALVTLWSLGFGLTWTFACKPQSAFWSWPYIERSGGKCLDTWLFNRVMSISDFLIDVLIMIIPVPLVWRLHLKTRRKIAVLIVFFLGSIAVAASILRMIRIIWASSSLGVDADGLLVNTTVVFWGMIEAQLALFAACLPTLRGLLKTKPVNSLIEGYRSRAWLKSSSQRSSNYKTSGQQDGIPLANATPPAGTGGRTIGNKRSIDSRYKHPHDVTLSTHGTTNSVEMESVRRPAQAYQV